MNRSQLFALTLLAAAMLGGTIFYGVLRLYAA
jgi:hypothetical protein